MKVIACRPKEIRLIESKIITLGDYLTKSEFIRNGGSQQSAGCGVMPTLCVVLSHGPVHREEAWSYLQVKVGHI